jgi:hypothetical protein
VGGEVRRAGCSVLRADPCPLPLKMLRLQLQDVSRKTSSRSAQLLCFTSLAIDSDPTPSGTILCRAALYFAQLLQVLLLVFFTKLILGANTFFVHLGERKRAWDCDLMIPSVHY